VGTGVAFGNRDQPLTRVLRSRELPAIAKLAAFADATNTNNIKSLNQGSPLRVES
jgi:hypothetical protein